MTTAQSLSCLIESLKEAQKSGKYGNLETSIARLKAVDLESSDSISGLLQCLNECLAIIFKYGDALYEEVKCLREKVTELEKRVGDPKNLGYASLSLGQLSFEFDKKVLYRIYPEKSEDERRDINLTVGQLNGEYEEKYGIASEEFADAKEKWQELKKNHSVSQEQILGYHALKRGLEAAPPSNVPLSEARELLKTISDEKKQKRARAFLDLLESWDN
eukprot:m.12532 g.12532  ORF g.12532 m.12532 type:complete len:218 (+) comp24115_c0_seq1:34-687(+)